MSRPQNARDEPRARAPSFRDKALRFRAAAHANLAAGLHDPAAANAVNACINMVDALCVQHLGYRNASRSHHDLLRYINELDILSGRRSVVRIQVGRLIAVKRLAQYDGRLVTAGEDKEALERMERAFRAVDNIPPFV